MPAIGSSRLVRILFIALGTAMIGFAFLRGWSLFGLVPGVIYAALALGLIWLHARSSGRTGRLARVRLGVLVLFSVSVGYTLAFPDFVIPEFERDIHKNSLGRRVHRELWNVFAKVPGCGDLTLSSQQLDVLNVTISGSLKTRANLDRLRARVVAECPAYNEVSLVWRIILLDTGELIEASDQELFAAM